MNLGLRDATVVVNGGSKGMGRAAAEAFAAEGARVAVLARGRQALGETIAALLKLGASDAVPVQADITDAHEVAGAFGIVEERWGLLNVLVNATGPVGVGVGRLAAVDDAEWAATFDVGTIVAYTAALTSLSKNLSVSLAPEGILVNTRAGDPQEIGPVIAFIGSQVNSYMTGADINVDGGSHF